MYIKTISWLCVVLAALEAAHFGSLAFAEYGLFADASGAIPGFVWAGVAKALALALYAAYVLRNRTVRRLSVSIAIVMLAFGLWEATALRSNWSFRDAIEGDYVARLALSGVVFVVLGALEMARTRLTRP